MTVIFLSIYFILPVATNLIARGNVSSFIVSNYSPTLLPMTICLFLALKNIHQFFGKKLHSGYVEKIIAFVSSTTFGIFFLHLLVLDRVFAYFHLYPWDIQTPLVFYACLPAFLTFLISFAVIAVLRKIPYLKYFVG